MLRIGPTISGGYGLANSGARVALYRQHEATRNYLSFGFIDGFVGRVADWLCAGQ